MRFSQLVAACTSGDTKREWRWIYESPFVFFCQEFRLLARERRWIAEIPGQAKAMGTYARPYQTHQCCFIIYVEAISISNVPMSYSV